MYINSAIAIHIGVALLISKKYEKKKMYHSLLLIYHHLIFGHVTVNENVMNYE